MGLCKKYDKSGKEVIEKRDLEQESRYVKKQIKYKKVRNEDGNLTHVSWKNKGVEYIRNIQYENGKIIFMEYLYGQRKNTTQREYNENGQATLRKSTRFDEEGVQTSETIWKMVYNDRGDEVKKEFIRSFGGIVIGHHIEILSYEDGLLKTSENNALVGICPCSNNEIQQKTEYTYDENNTRITKNYTSKKISKERLAKTRKTVRTYTNELEF